jgi:hypothetical protein
VKLLRRVLRHFTAGDVAVALLALGCIAYYAATRGIFQGKASGDGLFGFYYLPSLVYHHTLDMGKAAGPYWIGYFTIGHADLMPKTVKTIAVPAFKNETTRYKLGRLLPADITREFITRTRYAVVSDPNQADAELKGDLRNFAAWPVITAESSRGTSVQTAVQVVVTLDIELIEKATGKTLFSLKGAEFRERYEVSQDPKAYFDESGTAAERVSRNVAKTVVSAVLEGF